MGYFYDDKGNKSMTRLLVFLAALTAYLICIGIFALTVYLCVFKPDVIDKVPLLILVEIVVTLLAYAGLKKIFQKKEEVKDYSGS